MIRSLLEAEREIAVDLDPTHSEVVLIHQIRDDLGNMVPLGWFGWGELHWYGDTPIHDELVAERGDPHVVAE